MSKFKELYDEVMKSVDEGANQQETPPQFGNKSTEPERPASFRVGPDGFTVKVPFGYRTKVGRDNRLVAYHPDSTVKEDKRGRLIVVPPGHTFKIAPNGTGYAIPKGATTVPTKDGGLLIKRRQSPFRDA